MGFARLLLAAVFCIALAERASAQMATLLADFVSIEGDNTIVASGNVEILIDGARLQASRIIFDGVTNTLFIEGPIILQQDDNTLILADSAELDQDLRNGVIRSARLVLAQQLQLAAAQLNRVDGRYTLLNNTVASSCKVCGANPVPLWEIRARKIIHDQQERQLYFENAQLRIANVPVFFLPRLRLPDPTLERSNGFLVPTIRTSSRLGSALKVPYFFMLGDSADLTVTPYISSKTNTLEARYRQAFARGRLQFDAAITRDDLIPGKTRAYLFAEGNFRLRNDFILQFNLESTSDSAYLLEYGFSEKDRLNSEISIRRTRADDYFTASLTNFRTLRGTELDFKTLLPNLRGEVLYEKRFFPTRLGGQGLWSVGINGHRRESTADQLGRDVLHTRARLKWSRSETFENGVIGRIGGELGADAFAVWQDSTYDPTLATFTPALEAELRWPLVKSSPNGAAQVLEPVLHLAMATVLGDDVPNEDSTLVEFDEGNLFAISRFPGDDRYELGARATLGLKWTRYDPKGWSLGLALGRVYRVADQGQFSKASGLDGQQSDWLLAGQYKLDERLSITARALFKDALNISKAETQIVWRDDTLIVASTYSWIVPDADENRPDLSSRMTMDAKYEFRRNWNASLAYLFDFTEEKSSKTTIGLQYASDCVSVDLSLSRRSTASTSVTPTTDFGLSVKLLGFGASPDGSGSACSGI